MLTRIVHESRGESPYGSCKIWPGPARCKTQMQAHVQTNTHTYIVWSSLEECYRGSHPIGLLWSGQCPALRWKTSLLHLCIIPQLCAATHLSRGCDLPLIACLSCDTIYTKLLWNRKPMDVVSSNIQQSVTTFFLLVGRQDGSVLLVLCPRNVMDTECITVPT